MMSCSYSSRPASVAAARSPARQSVVVNAVHRPATESRQTERHVLRNVQLLGAAAAAAAALSMAPPAFADFPGFKDILPSGGIEKSTPNPGNSEDMNKEDAEKTGNKPMGGNFEGPADSTPNIASKQTQVAPSGDEKKDRGNELSKTLSETDDSTVSDSMTGKALQ